MSKETLEKGWKEALLGASLATGAVGTAHAQSTPAPQVQVEDRPKFDPSSLHPELHPIAQLETNFGKMMNHTPHSKGDYHTAYGPLGMKVITAHDEYLKSKALQRLHPNLQEASTFTKEFKDNPQFYNNIAGHHWNKLKKLTGSVTKAVFAWRWGQGAAGKADDKKISKDPYVQKYTELASHVQKSEGPVESVPAKYGKSFSYDHLLSPEQIAAGYSMRVMEQGAHLQAFVQHNDEDIGKLKFTKQGVPCGQSLISDGGDGTKHLGKGLGKAMYSAAIAHGKRFGEEPMSKAIADIKPGKLSGIMGGSKMYDYSHVLKPEHVQAGYKMHVAEDPTEPHKFSVTLSHPSSKTGLSVGMIDGSHNPDTNSINPELADLHPQHHGKQLGPAMYEAFMAHGKHIRGATSVQGDRHSTMASKVHQKLSVKHGLGYKPEIQPGAELSPVKPYDGKYKPYQYALKYDEFAKNFEEWAAKKGEK